MSLSTSRTISRAPRRGSRQTAHRPSRRKPQALRWSDAGPNPATPGAANSPLPANALQLGEADPLRDDPKRRPGLDRLQLLRISNENDLCAGPLGLADEPRQLLRGNHSGLVDYQNVARTQFASPGLPAVIPGRQRPRGDARRFLEPLGGFPDSAARERDNPRAPRFARSGQHGALARSRQSDDDDELLLSGDMADGLLLFVGKI